MLKPAEAGTDEAILMPLLKPHILGIDPGLASLGWGIIEEISHKKYKYVASGRITTEKHKGADCLDDLYRRLSELRIKLGLLWNQYEYDTVAFEAFDLYGYSDHAAFIQLANVTGMIDTLYAPYNATHYNPLIIKSVVTGDRRADKKTIKRAVCRLLNWTPDGRTNNHEVDALAVALCHALVRKQ